jgi:hypothetical protein
MVLVGNGRAFISIGKRIGQVSAAIDSCWITAASIKAQKNPALSRRVLEKHFASVTCESGGQPTGPDHSTDRNPQGRAQEL